MPQIRLATTVLLLFLVTAGATAQPSPGTRLTAVRDGVILAVRGSAYNVDLGEVFRVVGTSGDRILVRIPDEMTTYRANYSLFGLAQPRRVTSSNGEPQAALQPTYERPSDSDRWHTIVEGPTIGIYLDRETLQRSNRRVTAWTWTARLLEERTNSGTQYDRALTQEEFDCAGRRARALTELFYLDGDSVASYSYEPPTKWSSWAPETDGEFIGLAVCEHRP